MRLGAIGDIVHTVPLGVALRRAHPEARIDWLVEARHRDLLGLFDLDVGAVAVDPKGAWRDTVRTILALRETSYDVVFDAQGLLKSAVLARLVGAARTIGFSREALREPAAERFYSETIAPDRTRHVAQQNLQLLSALQIRAQHIETPTRRLESPVADDVQRALGPYGIINPGAGWPNKQWPPERLGAAAAAIAARRGLGWAVVWGPGEEPLARRVEEASSGAAMAAPATGLEDLMALVQRAAIVVAGDTGPIHLAAAAGTPVVGLYGPTSPARNGPWSPDDITISRFAQCECHHKRRCTAASWCLETIGVDEIVEAIERRLAAAGT